MHPSLDGPDKLYFQPTHFMLTKPPMMTRKQIIRSSEQLKGAINGAGILELTTTSNNDLTLQDYLLAFKKYNILAEQFSEGALFLEKELGFAQLREPDPWIIMSNQGMLDENNPVYDLHGVLETLTSITDLLKAAEQTNTTSGDTEIQTLTILEQESGLHSSPLRISEALESVQLLYESCARILGLPLDDLEVISCDSGDDMFFDFRGSSKIIESVKELILSIWERVVFYRNRNLQERISLLTQSLPILDSITELEMNGSLSTSEGKLTRTAVINGVKKFLASGALIQEIREHTNYNERSLMAPEKIESPTVVPHINGVQKTEPENQQVQYTPPVAYPEPPMARPVVPQEHVEEDLSWDGILEDDLKTLRELIDKTKRNEEEAN